MIKKGLLWSIVPLAVMIGVSVYGWIAVPEGQQIPVHWGLDGTPDRYGDKWETLLMLPVLAVGLVGLFAVLPFIDPRGKNLQRSQAPYLVTWVGAMLVMAVVHTAATLAATGVIDPDLGENSLYLKGLSVLLGLLFLAIGNVLGKARPNWFMGVRTPWTLSSDRSWDKTHRLGGRLFVAAGLIGVVAPWLAPPAWALIGMVGALLASVFGLVVMSFVWWKTDPARETATPEEVSEEGD